MSYRRGGQELDAELPRRKADWVGWRLVNIVGVRRADGQLFPAGTTWRVRDVGAGTVYLDAGDCEYCGCRRRLRVAVRAKERQGPRDFVVLGAPP